MYDGSNLDRVAALEPEYRLLWSGIHRHLRRSAKRCSPATHASSRPSAPRILDARRRSVGELPAVSAPDDWFALTTRLRVVLEDPRQLLSGAVTDYASQQLVDARQRPAPGSRCPAWTASRTPGLRPPKRLRAGSADQATAMSTEHAHRTSGGPRRD